MGVANIPTKTDGSGPQEIGRVVIDRDRALGPDPRFEVPAEIYEKGKDAIIANAEAIGTSGAPAAGSIEARLIDIEAGGGAAPVTLPVEQNGAVGLWLFNNSLAAVVGNPLTVATGTERYTVGAPPADLAVHLDGATLLDQVHDATLLLLGAMTLQVLVKPNLVSTPTMHIAGFTNALADATEANNAAYQLHLVNGNFLTVFWEHTAGVNVIFSTALHIAPGQWTLITLRRQADGVTVDVDLNGKTRASAVLGNAPTGGTAAFMRVGSNAPPDQFRGEIAHVLVDNARRPDADVLRDANRCLPSYLRPG